MARLYSRIMTRRCLGTLVAIVGALLLADVALTLLWREPITWLQARGDQSRLEQRYVRLERSLGVADPSRNAAATLHNASIERAATRMQHRIADGDPIGRIAIPSIGLRMVAIQGTTSGDLQQGPGHYTETRLPGQPGTVGFAGHRTTYLQPFRRINELKPGQLIRVTMPYGSFDYTVTGHRIVTPQTVRVLNSRNGLNQIVLTACYPLYSAAKRIVVFGRLARIS